MALRWQFGFTNNDRENPSVWRVDIYDNDYTGAIVKVIGGVTPVRYKSGRKGQALLNDKFKSTFCTLSLRTEFDGQFDDINQSNDRFYFEIFKDGTLYDVFFVVGDMQSKTFSSRSEFFEIRGVDGLGLLKTKPLVDSGGNRYEGRASLITWLERAFSTINNYPIDYFSSITYNGTDVLDSTYLDASFFYRDVDLEVDVFCDVVVNSILSPFQFVKIFGEVIYIRDVFSAINTAGNNQITCEASNSVSLNQLGFTANSIISQDYGTESGSGGSTTGGIVQNGGFEVYEGTPNNDLVARFWETSEPTFTFDNTFIQTRRRKITDDGYGWSLHYPRLSGGNNAFINVSDQDAMVAQIYQRITIEEFSAADNIKLTGNLIWCLAGELDQTKQRTPEIFYDGSTYFDPFPNTAPAGSFRASFVISDSLTGAGNYVNSSGVWTPRPSAAWTQYFTAQIDYIGSGGTGAPSQPFLNQLGNVSIDIDSIPYTGDLYLIFSMDVYPFQPNSYFQEGTLDPQVFQMSIDDHSVILDEISLNFEPIESFTNFGDLNFDDSISEDAIQGGSFASGKEFQIDGRDNGTKYDQSIVIGNTPIINNSQSIFKGTLFDENGAQTRGNFGLSFEPGADSVDYGKALALFTEKVFSENLNRISLQNYNSDLNPISKCTDPTGFIGDYFVNYFDYDLKSAVANMEIINVGVETPEVPQYSAYRTTLQVNSSSFPDYQTYSFSYLEGIPLQRRTSFRPIPFSSGEVVLINAFAYAGRTEAAVRAIANLIRWELNITGGSGTSNVTLNGLESGNSGFMNHNLTVEQLFGDWTIVLRNTVNVSSIWGTGTLNMKWNLYNRFTNELIYNIFNYNHAIQPTT